MSDSTDKSAAPTAVSTWPARWLSFGGLVLVGATWPLWTGTSGFPLVPLLSGLRTIPLAVDCCLLTILVVAWLVALVRPAPHRVGRRALLTASASLAGLILLNQHRLQPWAWEFLLVGLLLAFASPEAAFRDWRWLIVSIYAWSALSKLDVTFFESHGPFLLEGLFRALGRPNALTLWSETSRTLLAAGVPLTELLVALLLAIPFTRMPGLVGSIAMHLILLLALGPLGHGHQPGVLLWNVFFIGQNLLLFANSPALSPTWRESNSGTHFAWLVTGAAIALPALEPFGVWDHWPGWVVYASRPERVYLSVADADAAKLAPDVQRWLEPAGPFDPWRQLRIDRWSLAAVKAPIYPQDRFAVGVGLAIANGPGHPDVRLVWQSPADRFNGKRTTRTISGSRELREFARRYRLNAQPRL